ncbi:hypothetical protein [Aquihabitans sp. McL0605]|uniref:hypothetical protein n=1 Tax=Aquihabitans sp. McL0605 TaxID=3415671 RepID=UPI003CE961C5
MFRRMLIGAAVLVALFAAPAAAQYDYTVNPGQVEPGGAVSVSGQGCAPGATVTITMTEGDTTATRALGDVIFQTTVVADANGEFTVEFNIPDGTPVGTYTVTSTCGDTVVGSETIDVVSATTTTPSGTGSGSGGTIVRTGSDLTGLGLVGAGLLTLGGIFLIATKSRRNLARA